MIRCFLCDADRGVSAWRAYGEIPYLLSLAFSENGHFEAADNIATTVFISCFLKAFGRLQTAWASPVAFWFNEVTICSWAVPTAHGSRLSMILVGRGREVLCRQVFWATCIPVYQCLTGTPNETLKKMKQAGPILSNHFTETKYTERLSVTQLISKM